jgi:hypothetical protein
MPKQNRITKRKLSSITSQPDIHLPNSPLPSPPIETPPGHLSTRTEISQVVQELNRRLLDDNRDQLLIEILRHRETQLRSQLLAEVAAKTKRIRDTIETDTASTTATTQLTGEQTAKCHIKDLDGILHYTRVKPDVNKRGGAPFSISNG